MFIFIYNTLVLDVKRIDLEARMIDTLRSSSRVLFFCFFFIFLVTVCLFINPHGLSLFSRPYLIYIYIYIFAMLLPVTDNCSARCIRNVAYTANIAQILEISLYAFISLN